MYLSFPLRFTLFFRMAEKIETHPNEKKTWKRDKNWSHKEAMCLVEKVIENYDLVFPNPDNITRDRKDRVWGAIAKDVSEM